MASQPTTGDPPFRHRTVLRDGEAFDSTFEDWHRRNHVSFKGYLPPKTTKRARTIAPHLRQPIRSDNSHLNGGTEKRKRSRAKSSCRQL